MYFNRRIAHWSLALALVAFAACGQEAIDPTGPGPEGAKLQTVSIDGFNHILRPDRNSLVPAGWTTVVIGPEGGSISTDGATLSVPAGALFAPVLISMAGRYDPTWKYRFGPSGLQFATPSRLLIQVDPAALGIDPSRLKVAGSDDLGLAWEAVPGTYYDPALGGVVAPIHHFSQYVLCAD